MQVQNVRLSMECVDHNLINQTEFRSDWNWAELTWANVCKWTISIISWNVSCQSNELFAKRRLRIKKEYSFEIQTNELPIMKLIKSMQNNKIKLCFFNIIFSYTMLLGWSILQKRNTKLIMNNNHAIMLMSILNVNGRSSLLRNLDVHKPLTIFWFSLFALVNLLAISLPFWISDPLINLWCWSFCWSWTLNVIIDNDYDKQTSCFDKKNL